MPRRNSQIQGISETCFPRGVIFAKEYSDSCNVTSFTEKSVPVGFFDISRLPLAIFWSPRIILLSIYSPPNIQEIRILSAAENRFGRRKMIGKLFVCCTLLALGSIQSAQSASQIMCGQTTCPPGPVKVEYSGWACGSSADLKSFRALCSLLVPIPALRLRIVVQLVPH